MPRKFPASIAPALAWARRLAGPLSAVVFVAAATTVRLWLGQLVPNLSVFSLYYPAILGAALIGGEGAAVLALLLSAGLGGLVLQEVMGAHLARATLAVNLLIFMLAGAFVGATGAQLRRLLVRRRRDIARLAEREARYRALFDGVSEGFSLIEGVWGEHGRLVDFDIIEANPALHRMFLITAPLAGRRNSEIKEPSEPDYLPAAERAFRGEQVRIEIFARHVSRWFDIRLTRVGENRVAQIVVDISDRKAAESRQVEMFDELNHRVKNNLASVSAMLSMQARGAADAGVRAQLQKAVDRIETIAHVHASLYRASSTDQVDFTAYLRRLCERLATSLVDGERVRLEVEADPAMAPLDEAVALGLIVNELVTNAAKYAYPAPSAGVIRVELRNRQGELVLRVSDDGGGLPKTPGASGIGMRLVRSLVQQCRGELQVGEGAGACFTIRLREHGGPAADAAQSSLL